MEGISLGVLSRPLITIGTALGSALAPKLKQLRAERRAADSANIETRLLESIFDETLNRLQNITANEVWWQELLQRAASQYVRPEYLEKLAIREWLSESAVRDDLKVLARNQLLPGSSEDASIKARLADRYSAHTGEAARLATGPIDAIVNILLAGALALASKSDLLLAGFVQESSKQTTAQLSRIEKKLGGLVPVPSEQATRAAIDVKSRIDELLGAAFFGRDAEFETLDRFVEKLDRGLAIVAAPAGAGKSAFLARWTDSRRNSGDLVVRHFVSSLYGGTTDTVEMLRHLAAQLREFEIGESEEYAQAIPYAEGALLDNLTDNLSRPPRDCKRLIIVIDGLDELASPLKDVFVRPNLAAGVFVVVSARAAPDETPSFLQRWHDVTLGTIPRRRFDVFGLSDAEIRLWLQRVLGAELQTHVASLVRQLQETTDGFPLFLQFVIADLSTRLPQASSPEIRAAIIRDLPAPFSSYVARELDDLRNAMAIGWTESVRMLFAVLSRARGPLSPHEIEDFFRVHRRSDATFPACPILTGLDFRVRRWFSIRRADASEYFAFAHPRLALAFAEALGAESQSAEDLFIAWMDASWRTSSASQNVDGRIAYALDWLALHLEERGRKNEAAILLSSPTFLKEQLRDPKRALARLGGTLDHWNRLDQDTKRQVTGAAQWTAFWAENETAIKYATLVAVKAGLNTWQPALQCLGDTATSGSDVNAPASFCSVTHSPTRKGLVRSIDDAHSGEFGGVKLVGNRLVSWNEDGAIRFWSLDGASIPGGDRNAHRPGSRAIVSVVSNRLVSWGNDGALRFWSLEGELLPGGDAKAHSMAIRGVKRIGNHIVSWGADGALRLWSLEGSPLPGGDEEAHSGGVSGVRWLKSRMITWGADGALRFWSLEGDPLPGGDAKAHSKAIRGVKRIGDHIVSWGADGALRLWSPEGSPLPGGDEEAHSGGVSGVGWLKSRMITWGEDGALRFWSLEGDPLPGGDAKAHSKAVRGITLVGNRIVSWGEDGAIRFWSLNGKHLSGGTSKIYSGRTSEIVSFSGFGELAAVFRVGNRLVSWGVDGPVLFWSPDGAQLQTGDVQPLPGAVGAILGAGSFGQYVICWGLRVIRFWSPDGMPLGIINAHDAYVEGILKIGDLLISWANDGAIRFWSLMNALRPISEAQTHPRKIQSVLPVKDRCVSWDSDGGFCFWSLSGVSLPGGDRNAHAGRRIENVLQVNNRLVSYCEGGAIRFWSLDGSPVPGGDLTAHSGRWVRGMLKVEDHLVSWGADGAIRFWSLDGRPIPGGDLEAHSGWVLWVVRARNKLVSCGSDGAVRFWELDGTPASDGDLSAHAREHVRDIKCNVIDDRIVTWAEAEYGNIRFWSPDGSPLPSDPSIPSIPTATISGALPIDRTTIITWDWSNISIWTFNSRAFLTKVIKAHAARIEGLRRVGNRVVRADSDQAASRLRDHFGTSAKASRTVGIPAIQCVRIPL